MLGRVGGERPVVGQTFPGGPAKLAGPEDVATPDGGWDGRRRRGQRGVPEGRNPVVVTGAVPATGVVDVFPREAAAMQRQEWIRWLVMGVIVWGAAFLLGDRFRGTTLAQAPAAANNPGATAGEAPTPLVVWEYKVVRVTEELLNQAGAEGWEVVAAVGDVKGQSAGMRAINTNEKAILKRVKRS